MNAKQLVLSIVLAGFATLTAVAVYDYGYIGFFEVVLSNAVGLTCLADLTIALTLFLLWMQRDAKEIGLATLPYLILTLALGSVGPLLYLIRREGKLAARTAGVARPAVA